jgi:hypothetical protein
MRNVRNYEMNQGVYQTRQRPGGKMEPGNRFIANYKPAPGRQFVAPRSVVVGLILVIALLAFEIFNFDTTRYALNNLFGDVRFAGIAWASLLAFAFCAIDFAGLAYMMAPERSQQESNEVWYIMGAWLLGATMNAMMTWWAVSLVLLDHNMGNEVLSREQLLTGVPIFVAVMVWLTRILFIGAFAVAGARLFRPDWAPPQAVSTGRQKAAAQQAHRQPAPVTAAGRMRPAGIGAAAVPHLSEDLPGFLHAYRRASVNDEPAPVAENRPLIDAAEGAVDPLVHIRTGLRRVRNDDESYAATPELEPASLPTVTMQEAQARR